MRARRMLDVPAFRLRSNLDAIRPVDADEKGETHFQEAAAGKESAAYDGARSVMPMPAG